MSSKMGKQLSLFDEPASSVNVSQWKLYIDGASRGNPGPAGAGVYLVKDDKPVFEQGFFLGNKTNNQAEYLALIIGLFYARAVMSQQDHMVIYSDSQLLVRQIMGHYKIKNEKLRILHEAAILGLKNFNHRIDHIFREHNKVADRCANRGIDERVVVPSELQHFLL